MKLRPKALDLRTRWKVDAVADISLTCGCVHAVMVNRIYPLVSGHSSHDKVGRKSHKTPISWGNLLENSLWFQKNLLSPADSPGTTGHESAPIGSRPPGDIRPPPPAQPRCSSFSNESSTDKCPLLFPASARQYPYPDLILLFQKESKLHERTAPLP